MVKPFIYKQHAESEIIRAVNDITAIYPEGEPFFDAMDDFLINMASRSVYNALFEMAATLPLILTGGFGKRIARGIDSGEFPNRPYILFKGGLRKGNNPEVIKFSIDEIKDDTKFVFVDDTIYGGNTYFKIKEFLKIADIKVMCCVVVYDGCPHMRQGIFSIFRYYDHFKNVKPNFEFSV